MHTCIHTNVYTYVPTAHAPTTYIYCTHITSHDMTSHTSAEVDHLLDEDTIVSETQLESPGTFSQRIVTRLGIRSFLGNVDAATPNANPNYIRMYIRTYPLLMHLLRTYTVHISRTHAYLHTHVYTHAHTNTYTYTYVQHTCTRVMLVNIFICMYCILLCILCT